MGGFNQGGAMDFDLQHLTDLASEGRFPELVHALIAGATEQGKIRYDGITISGREMPAGMTRVNLLYRATVDVVGMFLIPQPFVEALKDALYDLFKDETRGKAQWMVDIPKPNELAIRLIHGSTERYQGVVSAGGRSPQLPVAGLPLPPYARDGGIPPTRR